MKRYLSYVPISSKVHKKQNRLMQTCIIFAVFLVVSVFSMVDMIIKEETRQLVEKHGAEELKEFLQRPSVMSLYPVALVLFVLILLAGVLMISSSMSSNVAKRTSFFGMMRCIGMSKKQIIRTVRLEGLYLCRTAVPIGIGIGTALTWIICAALKYGVGGEWYNIPQFGISIIGIISGIVLGVTTVLIAARKPARLASKVSPIEAISGKSEQTIFKKNNAFVKLKIENALGFSHATKSKSNLLLRSGSIALSIVLFLSFSVFIKLVNCLMPKTPDVEIMASDSANVITPDVVDKLLSMNCVDNITTRSSAFDVPVAINNKKNNVTIISMSEQDMKALIKDGFLNSKASLNDAINNKDSALIIADYKIENGTDINVFDNKINIVGQLSYDPFTNDGLLTEDVTLLVNPDLFTKLCETSNCSYMTFDLSNNITQSEFEEIKALFGENCNFSDLRENDNSGTLVAFLFCVYGFLIIIALVSTLNIVNSISLGVTARMKQYGGMRAVGMSTKQIVKTIKAETLTYCVTGLILGVGIGLTFSKWLFGFLVTSHYAYVQWSFPAIQLLIILVFTAISTIAGIYIPSKNIKKMSVTQTINEM